MSSLRLNQIVVDDDIQPRAKGLDRKHVDELADALRDGNKLPPVVVYDVGDTFLLSEGFHRHAAYTQAKKTHIPCEVRKGPREECKLNALASNQGHGLKRTNADKLRALTEVAALQPKWSDGKLAEFIGVSRQFVTDNRPQVSTDGTSDTEQREGRDGKKYNTQTKSQVATVATCEETKPTKTSVSGESTPDDEQPAAVVIETDSAPLVPDKSPPPEPVIPQVEQPDGDTEQSPMPVDEDPSDAFCETLNTICRELDTIGQRVAALKESPYGRFVHWQSAQVQIKNGRETLWQGRPTHQCPYCRKAGEIQPNCRCCGGLNVCTKQSYKSGVAAVGGVEE